jgi:hypothetical protein
MRIPAMRRTSILCFKRLGPALILLLVLGLVFSVSVAECAPWRKKANMSVENTKKQVAERMNAFRKTGELAELRSAANLIERIEVHNVPVFEDRQAARTVKLDLWLTLLDTIDSAKDPKFDPTDVPATRITVPPGTPMKPDYPVTTPEGIADPAERRKYDEAVAANDTKTKRYRVQKELRQLDLELTSRADAYIGTAHLRSPQSVKEMNAAIAAHIHNAERAAHLRSLVAP